MRIERLAGIGCLLLMAAAQAPGQERELAVGLENSQVVPFTVLAQAQATAARIYAGIGVKLIWRSKASTEIWMQFDTGVAADVHPGAIGYAMPYGRTGTRIHILPERVDGTGSRRLGTILLGHVMAHELGHVLEGLNRHSESGVMKARWDDGDLDEMLVRPLSFSSTDAEWIHEGLAKRALQAGLRPPAAERKDQAARNRE